MVICHLEGGHLRFGREERDSLIKISPSSKEVHQKSYWWR
jgi:hypothetical protein